MLRTYKFRLYPTAEQQEKIQFTIDRCRLLYNRLLEERINAYKTEGKTLTYRQQANTFRERKQHVPTLKEVYSQVLQDVARRLDKTYQSFFRRVKNGEKAGFPRFKPQIRYNSFTYPQRGFTLEGTRLELSKIGHVRIKLHRQPQGTIKTCTITIKNGRYYTCLSCEVEAQPLPVTDRRVGVDLVKHLAATSDGQLFAAPHHLRKSEAKLKCQQRVVSRKRRGSKRRRKAVMALARQHEHVASQRKDYAHQISRKLVDHYDIIAFEDLNVQGMVKNHHLAKSIADAGWNQLVQFVTYKAESAGRHVVRVDPRQTSQCCSTCNEIVKKTLAERVHRCPHCGTTLDRDVNAAINILMRAIRQVS